MDVLGKREQGQTSSSRFPVRLSGLLGLAGLFFAGDLSVWHWSLKLTSVANATLLVNFAPVFVTLGGWLIFGQRVRMIFILGMVLALSGMAMIAGNSFQISLQFIFGETP